jgi:GH15 family glucan-1,4-alpha-glucosidase
MSAGTLWSAVEAVSFRNVAGAKGNQRAEHLAGISAQQRGTDRGKPRLVRLPRLIVSLALVAAIARPAHAVDPVASFRFLVTGNGFGFQVFDTSANAVKQFLERPYRYLRANPTNPDAEGVVRRNLAFDTYFGVKVGAQAAWFGGKTPSEIGYVDQSNIIKSVVTVNGVTATSYFVAPFGYQGNALVMLLQVTNSGGGAQPVSAYSIHNMKLGSAPDPDAPGANGEAVAWDGSAATETGPGGGAFAYVPLGGADQSSCAADAFQQIASGNGIATVPSCNGTDVKNAFAKDLGSVGPGQSKWWGVAVLFDADGNATGAKAAWDTFLAGRTADKLYTDLLTEWEGWRKPPIAGLSDTEVAIWRQAEAVLRMGQIREPFSESPRRKNYGMILASLPPGPWHTGWVRDAMYATGALARTGHYDEAKLALDFLLNADAGKYSSYVHDVPYRVSTVRYFGDGEEEADLSGQPTRNVEIDGWGLALWAARTYVDASGDTAWLAATTAKGDTVYDALKNGVAEAIATNLEDSGMPIADASIWEVHWGNRQHFLYTAATAARGLCDMATLAKRAGGHDDDIAHYRDLHDKVVESMKNLFIDQNHVLAGSLERLSTGANYHDGATVEAITWNLLPGDSGPGKATLDEMSFLQTPAGGYKRVEGSNDQYDTDEWILIDLRASDAFRRAGQTDKADQLLTWVTAQASVNNNLLPELYNTRSSTGQIGAYSGSIPMVGYGAGAYQLTLLDRAGAFENTDCGQFDGSGDGGTGGDDDGGNGRSGVACACSGGGRGGEANALVFGLAALLVWRRRR